MKKILVMATISMAVILALPTVALAHVVVTPSKGGVGERVMFNVSVPNERQSAVTSIKLEVPAGVQDLQPDVMAGWQITTTENSQGNPTSVIWVGTIPVGQRADLEFRAQLPAQPTSLNWKAHQTYADGVVVNWNQDPAVLSGRTVKDNNGPYSITKVVDDLAAKNTSSTEQSRRANLALVLSVAALALSLGSLFLPGRRLKNRKAKR